MPNIVSYNRDLAFSKCRKFVLKGMNRGVGVSSCISKGCICITWDSCHFSFHSASKIKSLIYVTKTKLNKEDNIRWALVGLHRSPIWASGSRTSTNCWFLACDERSKRNKRGNWQAHISWKRKRCDLLEPLLTARNSHWINLVALVLRHKIVS